MAEKRHWRSFEELENTDHYQKMVEREFSEGASEAPTGISRRQMLGLMGATVSLAGLASCRRPVEKIVPYVNAPENVVPGIPRKYATTMPFGTSAYGLLVESREGRPTKIEGNPEHPTTQGRSNTFMQAETLRMYDPDRSTRPMTLGEPATWDDFKTALGSARENWAGNQGAGTAILSAPFASPTLHRLRQELLAAFPGMQWVTWEPLHDFNLREGVRLATGTRATPYYDLTNADVVVSVSADILGSDRESVRHAAAFAAGRKITDSSHKMNRLYAVESAYSVTGGMADHRMALPASQMPALVSALIQELRSAGLSIAGSISDASAIDKAWVKALAKDLMSHRGRSVLIGGNSLPAEVHAALLSINQALGNMGQTIEFHARPYAQEADPEALTALQESMSTGEIKELFILESNPVYAAPGFEQALKSVPFSVHFGYENDETAKACTWHLNAPHFLETWGDAAASDGTLSVIQPLIAPLYDAMSPVELIGLILTGEEASGYDTVRATWAATGIDSDSRWNKILHDGLMPGASGSLGLAATAPVSVPESGAVPSQDALELVMVPSTNTWDGRYANNGWMQELPDPITKITWTNAACVGPATFHALGFDKGPHEHESPVITITAGGSKQEVPVWTVPGQAENTIAVLTGYGRKGGRVAEVAQGANAFKWMEGRSYIEAVNVRRNRRSVAIACTQDHGSLRSPDRLWQEGRVRPMVQEADLEYFKEHPEFAQHAVEHPPLKQLFGDHEYDGHRWGMTIDLNACTGCNACVIACQAENNIPVVGPEQVMLGREMHWLRIDRYFTSDAADPEAVTNPQMVVQPVPCMHCENAPCEQVCPVAATVHDDEGLNVMVYNRCIGTRYCSNNCPYKVRRFNFFNFTKDLPKITQLAMNPDVTVRSRGVMEKCSYCLQRISAVKVEASLEDRPVRDGEVQTACQQACPTQAIMFGDLANESAQINVEKASPRNYEMLVELNVRPRTTYLAKLRNPNPELPKPEPVHAIPHEKEQSAPKEEKAEGAHHG